MICSNLRNHAIFLLVVLLLALVQTSLAQNYHFSNGWYAGKKRSSSSPNSIGSDSSSSFGGGRRSSRGYSMVVDEPCSMRPDAIILINRIVQDEVARIQKSCISEMPSGLSEILENAANTIESDGK